MWMNAERQRRRREAHAVYGKADEKQARAAEQHAIDYAVDVQRSRWPEPKGERRYHEAADEAVDERHHGLGPRVTAPGPRDPRRNVRENKA